jgi:hypothetical protein
VRWDVPVAVSSKHQRNQSYSLIITLELGTAKVTDPCSCKQPSFAPWHPKPGMLSHLWASQFPRKWLEICGPRLHWESSSGEQRNWIPGSVTPKQGDCGTQFETWPKQPFSVLCKTPRHVSAYCRCHCGVHLCTGHCGSCKVIHKEENPTALCVDRTWKYSQINWTSISHPESSFNVLKWILR